MIEAFKSKHDKVNVTMPILIDILRGLSVKSKILDWRTIDQYKGLLKTEKENDIRRMVLVMLT